MLILCGGGFRELTDAEKQQKITLMAANCASLLEVENKRPEWDGECGRHHLLELLLAEPLLPVALRNAG
jgi:hypothetical protein